MKRKIVLYGISNFFIEIFCAMKPCYNIIGICDRDSDRGNAYAQRLCCTYICPDELDCIEYDILYVTTREEMYPDIFMELIYKRGVDRNKIQYYENFYQELEFSFGQENPHDTLYVMRTCDFKEGIGAMLTNMLVKMHALMKIIPASTKFYIDWMNYSNVYLEEEELGKVNAWEKYFVQPCGLTAEEVYNSKHVILCGIGQYSYRSYYNYGDLHMLYKKKIFLNDRMKKLFKEEEMRLGFDGEKTCAVFYRGTDYVLLKPYNHPIQPTMKQLIEKVYELKEKWGFEKIYFSTEDAKAHRQFLREFGKDVIFSEREMIEKYPLKGNAVLSCEKNTENALTNVSFNREDDAFKKGMEYLRQGYFLSKCAYAISGLSGGYALMFTMSEGFKNSYIFDLGRYGLDDDSYATPWGHYILLDEEKKKDKE